MFRTDNAPDESLQQQRLQQFTTDDTVDKNKLAELGNPWAASLFSARHIKQLTLRIANAANSERLKSLLANPHLRDYLAQLDATPDAWKAMKVAMLEPLFVEFANECLAVVEPDVEAAIQPQLTASEQIVSDFCAHVVNQYDGVE